MLDAALGEIITTCSKLDWLINHGERVLSPEKRYNNLIMFYKKSYVHYEPLGVVSAIVSWNYRELGSSRKSRYINSQLWHQPYTTLGRPSLLLSSPGIVLSLSAPNMSFGQQRGSCRRSRSV